MESSCLVEVWRRCADQGRDGDWARLLERVDRRILAFLGAKLALMGQRADQDMVEELRQEVYLRLVQRGRRALRRCRATTDGQVFAYLYRVCGSVAVDQVRCRLAAKRGRGRTLSLEARSPCPDPRGGELSALDSVHSSQLRDRLRGAFRDLYPSPLASRNRWIFERVVIEGWTSPEVAPMVGLRPTSVDSLVHRMKKRLGEAGITVPERGTMT